MPFGTNNSCWLKKSNREIEAERLAQMSNEEKRDLLLKRAEYFDPDAHISLDEWLSYYGPITPAVLKYKFSPLIRARVERYLEGKAKSETEAFDFVYAYIEERLDEYDPQKGSQSNWIYHAIRGGVAEYKRVNEQKPASSQIETRPSRMSLFGKLQSFRKPFGVRQSTPEG